MENHEVFILCNDVLCGLTIIIVTIIGFYQIYLHWNATFIIKRHRVLHVQFLISVFLIEISTLISTISASFYGRTSNVYIVSRIFIQITFWSVICNDFMIRWLLYFNNNWTLATMKSKWEYIIIGNHIDNHETNWFIRNKNKYGQYNKIRKYNTGVIGVLCVVTCSIYVLEHLKMLPFGIYSIIVVPMATILCIIFGILICKTPKYMDIFYIIFESRMHLAISFMVFCIYIFFLFLWKRLSDEHDAVLSSIASVGLIYTWNGIFIVSTMIIVRKNTNANLSNIDSNDITLEYLLQNQDRMQLFMDHLYKEYNIELITSYIEVNYLLNKFIQLNDQINIENKQIENFYHELSSVMVRKDEYVNTQNIDANITERDTLKIHCGIIYTKYIHEYSEFQINIPGHIKSKFDDIMNNNEFNINNNSNYIELFDIFYDIKKEMRKMLKFSFERFKKSDNFHQIQDIINHHL